MGGLTWPRRSASSLLNRRKERLAWVQEVKWRMTYNKASNESRLLGPPVTIVWSGG